MPSILAIETATEACSAALYHDGKIYSRYQIAPQQHVSLILPMCEELLCEADITPADLSAVAFGQGPGSFTGVRIAAAVTQGMAVGVGLSVIPVSSLQALAQTAFLKYGKNKIIAGIDARMGEIYAGKFILDEKLNIMVLTEQEILISAEKAKDILSSSAVESASETEWFYAGSAFQQEEVVFPSADAIIPIAIYLWQTNKSCLPEKALPVYLRNNITF